MQAQIIFDNKYYILIDNIIIFLDLYHSMVKTANFTTSHTQ